MNRLPTRSALSSVRSQRNPLSSFLRALLLAGIAASFLVSCEKASKISTNQILPTGDNTSVQAVGGLALSFRVVEDIKLELLANGTDEKTVEVVANGALAGIGNAQSAGTGLHLQGSGSGAAAAFDGTLDDYMPYITEGFIKTMADPEAGLADGAAKLNLTKHVTGAAFKSLSDKMDHIPADQRQKLPGAMSQAAIGSLDDAGLNPDDIEEGIGSIMEETVANLDEAGFTEEDIGPVVSEVTKASVKGMKAAGVSKSRAARATKKLVSKAVGALGKSGVKPENVGDVVGPMLKDAVTGLGDLGLTNAKQLNNAIGALMGDAVKALKDANVNSKDTVGPTLGKVIKGAMAGVNAVGFTGDKMQHFVGDMMKNSVGALGDLGITNAADIEELSSTVSAGAIEAFQDFDIKDPAAIKYVSKELASGTMSALGSLKNAGFIDENAVKSASKAVSQRSVQAMVKNAQENGNLGAIGDMAAGLTTGMVAGLADAGWKASEISGMTASISEGFKEGASGGGFDAGTLDSMAASVDTSTSGWLSEMETHCKNERGTWHPEGWCEFPKAFGADSGEDAGINGPTFEEEEECYADGGAIFVPPDGKWYCDLSGPSLSSPEGGALGGLGPEECRAKGYLWLLGPAGPYCETAQPPSACFSYFDQASCSAAGCGWQGTYCQEASLLSCASNTVPDVCAADANCFWDSFKNLCVTDICKIDPNQPECQGDAAPGKPFINPMDRHVFKIGDTIFFDFNDGDDDFDNGGQRLTYECDIDDLNDTGLNSFAPCSLHGISFDPTNGHFNWTPDHNAAHDVVIAAIDPDGNIFERLFALDIEGSGGSSNLDWTSHPPDIYVNPGQAISIGDFKPFNASHPDFGVATVSIEMNPPQPPFDPNNMPAICNPTNWTGLAIDNAGYVVGTPNTNLTCSLFVRAEVGGIEAFSWITINVSNAGSGSGSGSGSGGLTVNLLPNPSNGPKTVNGPVNIQAVFSEPVSDFEAADVEIYCPDQSAVCSSGVVSNPMGSGTTYSFDVTPGADGDFGVSILSNSVTGDTSSATLSFSNYLSFELDTVANPATNLRFDNRSSSFTTGLDNTILMWDQATNENVNWYIARLYSDNACTALVHTSAQLPSHQTSYQITGLSNGTYAFKVETQDMAGNNSFTGCSPVTLTVALGALTVTIDRHDDINAVDVGSANAFNIHGRCAPTTSHSVTVVSSGGSGADLYSIIGAAATTCSASGTWSLNGDLSGSAPAEAINGAHITVNYTHDSGITNVQDSYTYTTDYSAPINRMAPNFDQSLIPMSYVDTTTISVDFSLMIGDGFGGWYNSESDYDAYKVQACSNSDCATGCSNAYYTRDGHAQLTGITAGGTTSYYLCTWAKDHSHNQSPAISNSTFVAP